MSAAAATAPIHERPSLDPEMLARATMLDLLNLFDAFERAEHALESVHGRSGRRALLTPKPA